MRRSDQPSHPSATTCSLLFAEHVGHRGGLRLAADATSRPSCWPVWRGSSVLDHSLPSSALIKLAWKLTKKVLSKLPRHLGTFCASFLVTFLVGHGPTIANAFNAVPPRP